MLFNCLVGKYISEEIIINKNIQENFVSILPNMVNIDKLTENSEKPAENSEKPAENSEKPAENSEKPAENSEKPAENSEKPAENSEKPAEKPVKNLNKKKSKKNIKKVQRNKKKAIKVIEKTPAEILNEKIKELPEILLYEKNNISPMDDLDGLNLKINTNKMGKMYGNFYNNIVDKKFSLTFNFVNPFIEKLAPNIYIVIANKQHDNKIKIILGSFSYYISIMAILIINDELVFIAEKNNNIKSRPINIKSTVSTKGYIVHWNNMRINFNPINQSGTSIQKIISELLMEVNNLEAIIYNRNTKRFNFLAEFKIDDDANKYLFIITDQELYTKGLLFYRKLLSEDIYKNNINLQNVSGLNTQKDNAILIASNNNKYFSLLLNIKEQGKYINSDYIMKKFLSLNEILAIFHSSYVADTIKDFNKLMKIVNANIKKKYTLVDKTTDKVYLLNNKGSYSSIVFAPDKIIKAASKETKQSKDTTKTPEISKDSTKTTKTLKKTKKTTKKSTKKSKKITENKPIEIKPAEIIEKTPEIIEKTIPSHEELMNAPENQIPDIPHDLLEQMANDAHHQEKEAQLHEPAQEIKHHTDPEVSKDTNSTTEDKSQLIENTQVIENSEVVDKVSTDTPLESEKKPENNLESITDQKIHDLSLSPAAVSPITIDLKESTVKKKDLAKSVNKQKVKVEVVFSDPRPINPKMIPLAEYYKIKLTAIIEKLLLVTPIWIGDFLFYLPHKDIPLVMNIYGFEKFLHHRKSSLKNFTVEEFILYFNLVFNF